ncbi:MAG: hypothetical protein LBJ60_00885 [Tannerellaceae bacterium]|nr:hypothetical protein [Tannerellaceae bacterium]
MLSAFRSGVPADFRPETSGSQTKQPGVEIPRIWYFVTNFHNLSLQQKHTDNDRNLNHTKKNKSGFPEKRLLLFHVYFFSNAFLTTSYPHLFTRFEGCARLCHAICGYKPAGRLLNPDGHFAGAGVSVKENIN